MLQKITNLKKLFKRNKTDVHTSLGSNHGTRCILHITNLALFGLVIILTVASVLVYYLIPVTTVSDLSEMIEAREREIIISDEFPDSEIIDADSVKDNVADNKSFSVINEKNMFSNMRKEWVVKSVIPKSPELKKERAKRGLAKKKALAGKPKKIILHGVVMAGDMKRALINNPLKGVSKKTTMYVEEGDELEGYKVTRIEKDLIRLDWHGEEIVVPLYSGINDSKDDVNTRNGEDYGRRKRGGLTKMDYRFNVVEDVQTEESLDAINVQDNEVVLADIPDKTSPYLVNNEPEYLSMPDFNDAESSGAVERKGLNKVFSDIKSTNINSSEDGQKAENAQVPTLVNQVINEKPGQKRSTGESAEILLHGIVIVTSRGIKKALVNIPMSPFRKERTLYVEEGDAFEGFKVTSIEPDLLRLDWYGNEMIVKFPLL